MKYRHFTWARTRAFRTCVSALVLAAMLVTTPAVAWGPATETAIVTTAVGVLSRDRSLQGITRLSNYMREGAEISQERQAELFPNFESSPIEAIEREMVLLQTVKGDRIDPYFAFRLGALGKLVAQVTAPMVNANPAVREEYYEDVEQRMGSGRTPELEYAQRLIVDPAAYFQRVRREASAQDTTIEVDYRTGEGFAGFANSALGQDVSRSINAVADVWYTIFADSVAGLDVARADVSDYFLKTIEFHLNRPQPNVTEASEALARLRERNLLDADTHKRAGDLFFAADLEERAMEQYEAALRLEPGRRDVMEKVAQYYVQKGERAQEEKRLEDAAEAFSAAQQANPLHPDAQRKLIEARDEISERDARLQQARQAISEGDTAMSEAEAAALNSNFAEAITELRTAQRAYATVTNEFPVEAETARTRLTNADLLMREYKGDLITNAQSLSGTGFPNDARRLAENAEDIGEEALRALLDREYRAAVQTLRQELQESLARSPQ